MRSTNSGLAVRSMRKNASMLVHRGFVEAACQSRMLASDGYYSMSQVHIRRRHFCTILHELARP
jgi:hypothetical protein